MSNQYRSSYVPAIVEDVLPPPPAPHPEPPLTREGVRAETAWLVVTLSIMLMTLVLFTAMIIDGSTARQAINAGTKFFALTMGLVVLILSGALTDILRAWWRERTERRRIDAWADLAEQAISWRIKVEDNRRAELARDSLPVTLSKRLTQLEAALDEARSQDAGDVQTPSYVAPFDNRGNAAFAQELHPVDTTREEALRWAMQLYLDTGDPNPHYVQLSGKPEARGRIQNIAVIGSARGAGSADARLWLLQRRVLAKRPGGYALNLKDFPTSRELRYVE